MICTPFLVLASVPSYSDSSTSHCSDNTMDGAVGISSDALVNCLSSNDQCTLILDCRPFMSYNTGHVVEAVNVHCPPILKRRSGGFVALENIVPDNGRRERLQRGGYRNVLVYDQRTTDVATADRDSNLYSVIKSLLQQVDMDTVFYLVGGYDTFSQDCPLLCASKEFSMLSGGRPALDVQPALPDDHPVEILPDVYLGSVVHSANRALLQRLGVSALVNVSSSCPNHFPEHFRYLHIPVRDSASEDLLRWFPESTRFIDEVRSTGGKVLVHCHAGRSRSATVCMAYLMRTLHLSLDAAFEHVRSRRHVVDPNLNFMRQLQAYSQRLEADRLALLARASSSVSSGDSSVAAAHLCPSPATQSLATSCLSAPASAAISLSPSSPLYPPTSYSMSAPTSLSPRSPLYAPTSFSLSAPDSLSSPGASTSPLTTSLSLPSSLSLLTSMSPPNSPSLPSSLRLPNSPTPLCVPGHTSSGSRLSVREAPAPVTCPSPSLRHRLAPPTFSFANLPSSPCTDFLPPPSPCLATDIPPPSPATPSAVQCFFSFSGPDSPFPVTHAQARTPELTQSS